jgi:signal-transduction protein with cAMP-binding, CBS, and nucleotidyltransferase domain
LKGIEYFKYIPDALLEVLVNESKEVIFQKDQYIIKEGEKANCIYVIQRGIATESTSQGFSNYSERKEVGMIISPHHIVLPKMRYVTSCVADAMVYTLAINIDLVSKLTKRIKQLHEYTWRESLYLLGRLYFT